MRVYGILSNASRPYRENKNSRPPILYYINLTDTLVLIDANNGTVRQTRTQGSIKIDFPSD